MKRKEGRLIGIGMALIMATTLLFINTPEANAQEIRNIRILGGVAGNLKELRVEPETLLVRKGTVVVWVNWARGAEVKVIFEEGKVCNDVTKGQTGFKLNNKNCFVTSWVSMGGTSSLQFNEVGTFKYMVEPSGASAGVSTRGEVVVLE